MARTLTVEGKNYVPSSALAARFSYTTDYLSKLAREGKLDATRVGRQWFITEESVHEFASSMLERKSVRRSELRTERISERQALVAEDSVTKTARTKKVQRDAEMVHVPVTVIGLPSTLIPLTLSVIVLACGLFLGFLGFVADQAHLTFADMGTGVAVLGEEFADGFSLPDESLVAESQVAMIDLSFLWDWLFIDREVEVVDRVAVVPVAPVTPTAPVAPRTEDRRALIMLDSETATSGLQTVRDSFSDEVDVEFDGEDTGIITPVFRADGPQTDESYRFLLVLITPESAQ